MTAHALIIAIEQYDQAVGMAKKLPNTLEAGKAFREWLQRKWAAEGRAAADTQVLFCSSPALPDGRGATMTDVIDCLKQLRSSAAGQADELFVFFSGHGFSFVDGGQRADVVMASNYVDRDSGAQACVNLDWMIRWLADTLGHGRHYYFIDACRNPMTGNDVVVNARLLTDPVGGASQATVYVLQSTLADRFADAGAGFPKSLIDGLHGKGRAKVWDSQLVDAMQVKYDSLRRYLKDQLKPSQPITSSVTGPEGESEAVLAILKPVPTVNLTIDLAGGGAEPGEVRIRRGRETQAQPHAFTTWPQTLSLEPDTYTVEVQPQRGTVTGTNPLRFDLYDDFTHTLQFSSAMPVPPPPPPPAAASPGAAPSPVGGAPGIGLETVVVALPEDAAATEDEVVVDVLVPPFSQVKLRNLDTGDERSLDASEKLHLPRGRYSTILRTSNRAMVRRRDLDLTEAVQVVDSSAWHESVPMTGIAEQFPEQGGWPDFSESLGGPVVDPDLNIWLALLGGGRILNGIQGHDFHKLAMVPLHDFSGEAVGSSPFYVLVGLEDTRTTLDVRIENAGQGWRAATATEIDGVRHFYQPSEPGPRLVSLRWQGKTYTLASVAMPHRATLLTVTRDAQEGWRIGQYVLPLGTQADHLPADVVQGLQLDSSPLEKLRFLAQAQRAFRRRSVLRDEFKSGDLDRLLDAKWLDPVGSALASYELIRRGTPGHLPPVVQNMRQYFPQLPDTPALGRLSTLVPDAASIGPPLFQDGLRAWPEKDWPLPASHLDFSSPWTAWRLAVT